MEFVCKFEIWEDQFYTCTIKNTNITEPGIKLSIQEKRLDGYSNNDVTRLRIAFSKVEYMPVGLGELFPNLKILQLFKCGLKRITKNDLIGMQNLETIWISHNPIKYIPGDLFEYTRNLKAIFIQREIQFIEECLIDGLEKLQYLSIGGCNFNIHSGSVKVDFTEIKTKLKSVLPNDEERKKYDEETKRLKEIVDIKNRSTSTVKKRKGISKAFISLLESGRFSDMKIIIEDETFKVHKVVLGTHSSVLADIFENNENVKELSVKEIKKGTCKNILNFCYKNELPAADANYLDLYSVSGQLNIVALMQICEDRIKIEERNMVEVVIAAQKFGSQTLKDEAYEFIKKKFPNLKISNKLIENLEDLKNILKTLEILKKYSTRNK